MNLLRTVRGAAPSPGTPGEGWGEGFLAAAFAKQVGLGRHDGGGTRHALMLHLVHGDLRLPIADCEMESRNPVSSARICISTSLLRSLSDIFIESGNQAGRSRFEDGTK